MTHDPMMYVAKGPDGLYRDRSGLVVIAQDDVTGRWWLTCDGGTSPHTTLTDARVAAHRATKVAA